MWLCSCHHRPSPELLRLAKPKPSSRNVNPLPLPFPSLPRPLGTPIPLSLPTGGTTQAPPMSGRPLGTRRLSSGVCPACLTQQNAPTSPPRAVACVRVPWRVSAATAEGHSAARTERALSLLALPPARAGRPSPTLRPSGQTLHEPGRAKASCGPRVLPGTNPEGKPLGHTVPVLFNFEDPPRVFPCDF